MKLYIVISLNLAIFVYITNSAKLKYCQACVLQNPTNIMEKGANNIRVKFSSSEKPTFVTEIIKSMDTPVIWECRSIDFLIFKSFR